MTASSSHFHCPSALHYRLRYVSGAHRQHRNGALSTKGVLVCAFSARAYDWARLTSSPRLPVANGTKPVYSVNTSPVAPSLHPLILISSDTGSLSYLYLASDRQRIVLLVRMCLLSHPRFTLLCLSSTCRQYDLGALKLISVPILCLSAYKLRSFPYNASAFS